ncbi:hypothetical protein [Catenuloplanes indicus]|uniref:Uncharacterized protein n=1 Tax=Catenuloplanes indicus TaxID=137267 RepID=A0AAE4AWB8_9ACTN|nr:hypothetical protein [Catenuloplanes indicus]MDQ0364864.1 hypothetical protein [Catenuloplanes indicus]
MIAVAVAVVAAVFVLLLSTVIGIWAVWPAIPAALVLAVILGRSPRRHPR